MKHKHQYHHDKNLHPVNVPPVAIVEESESKHPGVDFGPTEHDVAKRAYYIFLNQGALPGYDIQHWQEAEAQLVAERFLTLDGGLPKSLKK